MIASRFLTILGFWIVLFLHFNDTTQAQCVEFEIASNGDTLNCKDKAGKKQGKWTNRVEPLRGEPGYEEEGVYKNNEKTGYWRIFSLEGDLIGIEQYHYGQKNGMQQYFNSMGSLIREESWLAYTPEKPTETVNVYDLNPSDKIKKVEVKAEGSSLPHGIWKMYDEQSGRLLRSENYILGKLSNEPENSSNGDEPKNQSDSISLKKEKPKEKPKPKEVQDFEKKTEGKKNYKIRTGATQ